jgi:TRAP-type C4-dicarboxylate transport system permease small subunit
MAERKNQRADFLGTYFNKESVLRISSMANIVGWLVLAAYILEWSYSQWQSIYNSMTGGFPVDVNFIFFSLPRLIQGVMLLVILQAISKALLILLDIEDNTRRSARD